MCVCVCRSVCCPKKYRFYNYRAMQRRRANVLRHVHKYVLMVHFGRNKFLPTEFGFNSNVSVVWWWWWWWWVVKLCNIFSKELNSIIKPACVCVCAKKFIENYGFGLCFAEATQPPNRISEPQHTAVFIRMCSMHVCVCVCDTHTPFGTLSRIIKIIKWTLINEPYMYNIQIVW